MNDITALVYVDFFRTYKFKDGGILEGYTTQPFQTYIGVNVPVEWIDGSLGTDNDKIQIRIPYPKEEVK